MLCKASTLLILVFLTISCHPQIQSDAFKKYSYHITGIAGNKPLVGGTSFFVKYNSKYFLVSAWHCFTFKNHLTETFENPESTGITSIVVYRNLADISPDNFMRITIKSTITNDPTFFKKRLNDTLVDISAIEVYRNLPFEFDYIDVNDIDTSDIEINDSIIYND